MEPDTIRLHIIDLPLIRPFVTADGSVSERRVGIVELSGDGLTGWGEAAPYPGQDEPFEVVTAAAAGRARSRTYEAAIDQARADWEARHDARPLAAGDVDRLPISIAVGWDDPEAVVASYVERGVRRFKVKVAPGHVDHVLALRAAHPDIVIGIDANRSFDAASIGDLDVLVDVGIAYVEEPLARRDRQSARRIRDLLSAPIFADESIASWADLTAALEDPTVDGVTIKPGRLGWTRSLEAASSVEVAGKLWRASGLLESGVGRAYTDCLATRSPAISDVAPAEAFLAEDLVASRWLPEGAILAPPGPGAGVEPDRERMERYTIEVVEAAPLD